MEKAGCTEHIRKALAFAGSVPFLYGFVLCRSTSTCFFPITLPNACAALSKGGHPPGIEDGLTQVGDEFISIAAISRAGKLDNRPALGARRSLNPQNPATFVYLQEPGFGRCCQ